MAAIWVLISEFEKKMPKSFNLNTTHIKERHVFTKRNKMKKCSRVRGLRVLLSLTDVIASSDSIKLLDLKSTEPPSVAVYLFSLGFTNLLYPRVHSIPH